MLQVHKFSFNPFQENTYIIANEHNNCWIIDPGMSTSQEQQILLDFIKENQLKPKAIYNTHAHIDHILGIDFVAQYYQIPFYLHEKEMPILLNAATTAKMFGFQYEGVKTEAQFVSEKLAISLDEDMLEILLIPGHSPGSIAFYSPTNNWVISGDALFAGSIGRTDLTMGDYDTLIHSIKSQLLVLPDETIVYSGHGESTNIKNERENNPFLK